MEELKEELKLVRRNKHPKLKEFEVELVEKRKEREWIAQLWKAYQLEVIEKLFSDEKIAAEEECEQAKSNLKEKLLHEFVEKKRKAQDPSENESESIDNDTEKRRSRRRADDRSRRGREQSVIPDTKLSEDQIEEDINLIGCDAFGRRKTKLPQLHDSYYADGKLFYDELFFEKGQAVKVNGTESYLGTIVAINSSEILITRDDSKSRIYLSQLRSGKITISKEAEK